VAFEVENLSWVKQLPRFSDEEQKVLLALSDERYKWRTIKGIVATTGLEKNRVKEALATLIQDGFVRPWFSRNQELIYGLVERLE
jgi:hypothetical protein